MMSIMVPNIQLAKDVCEELGLNFRILGENGNLLAIKHSGKEYFFTYTTTPFNREDVQHICNDKSLIQELASLKVRMPKTKKYLRPDLNPNWHDKIEFSSESEIVANIQNNLKFPFMVKMNAGSLGRNVFKCNNGEDVKTAVEKIFEEDWALLAQELIHKETEFRVMVVNNSVELAYYKSGNEFFPMDNKIFLEIKTFLAPLQEIINLGWAGLDVILDKEGKLWLIEINTRPSFIGAVRQGKQEEIKTLYRAAIQNMLG